jgi:hypothetical protein
MKLRVIDKNIVAERIIGIEGDSDHITQKVERTDITTDTINCVIEYLSSQDKFDKDGYVTISDNDVILCLMDKNKFTLVKDDVLETYKNNTVELEKLQARLKTKQQITELQQAKLNSQEQSQEVIDGEFTEAE